jgi:SMI1-KNR4 cell-wall
VWRELILGVTDKARFADPAESDQIEVVERELGVRLPRDLAGLLGETNGVTDEYGGGLIWQSERIASDNRTFRGSSSLTELYMPFDALLFFADAGNGDQFAFPITGVGPRDDVFVWDHEDDSRRWYAGSLEQYLVWWLGGDHPI